MRTIPLDSTILNTTVACGRKVKMEFIDNWRPAEKPEALEKGDLLHQMFAHYYRGKKEGRTKTDMGHALLIAEAIAKGREAATPMALSQATIEEDIRQFRENILYWQRDGWKILEVEQSFSKVLFERPDDPEWLASGGARGKEGIRILYEGIIDLVVETPSPNMIAVVDHKSASRKSNPVKTSNQFMGYCYCLGYPQIIINRVGFQKTLSPEERFQRLFISYEKELLKEWVQQAVYWAQVLASYIDNNYFPPNFTSCDKYAGCIFQQVCNTIPQVRDFKLQSFYYQGEPWSPHTRDKKLLLEEEGEDAAK